MTTNAQVRTIAAALTGWLLSAHVAGAQAAFPSTFKTQTITVAEGVDIFVRSGGSGPAVILIHGFGDTGDMWAPLAGELSKSHTVIVPDLRGMGLSSHPAGAYDQQTRRAAIRSVL